MPLKNPVIANTVEFDADMTDEEYAALDEYCTRNTPKISGNTTPEAIIG
jgi:hypothetical protein